MKKKTYSAPNITVIPPVPQQLLAGSAGDRAFSNSDATTDDDGNYNDARGFDFFDDEEDY